jgi:hypothetical protein
MDGEVAALEIEQPARTAEIVQQMAVDMEEIGIVANPGDDMLIPNLGQQRTTALFQQPVLPFGFMAGDICRRQPFFALDARSSLSKHNGPPSG